MYCLVGIISQGRQTHWILTRKIKNLHRMLVQNMQQENVGSVKKKDVEGELGCISAQMLLVYVVSKNVKERIADSPLILVNFF